MHYTHKTRTKHGKYTHKTHNSISGGEINTDWLEKPHTLYPSREAVGRPRSLQPLDPGYVNGLPQWIQRAGFPTPSVLSMYLLFTCTLIDLEALNQWKYIDNTDVYARLKLWF